MLDKEYMNNVFSTEEKFNDFDTCFEEIYLKLSGHFTIHAGCKTDQVNQPKSVKGITTKNYNYTKYYASIL